VRRALPLVVVTLALAACGGERAPVQILAAPASVPVGTQAATGATTTIVTAAPTTTAGTTTAGATTAAATTPAPATTTVATTTATTTTTLAAAPVASTTAATALPALAGWSGPLGGDPIRFCRSSGSFLTAQALEVFATPAGEGAAATELVFAPAVASLADELAAAGPAPLVPRLRAMAARAHAAVDALRAAGATPAQLAAVRDAILARTTSSAAAVVGGSPGDPQAYGLDRDRVRAAAAAFTAANGDAATFRQRLDELSPVPPDAAVAGALAATWPCLADLLAPDSGDGADGDGPA
jgi:hypothetical protein